MLGNGNCESESNCIQPDPDAVIKVKSSEIYKKKQKAIPICWFYAKKKSCRFEDNCRFRHSIPKSKQPCNDVQKSQDETKELPKTDALPDVETKVDIAEKHNDVKSHAKREKRPCMFFFRYKSCKFGNECEFSHARRQGRNHALRSNKVKIDEEKDDETPRVEDKQNQNETVQKFLPTKDINLEDLTEEMTQELRAIEIKLLMKRFRGNQRKISEDSKHIVLVKATDPDWPFDVKSIWLEVDIPEKYPKEILKVYVSEKENEILPELFIVYLNDELANWLVEKFEKNLSNSVTELVFRPFLRWLDKNMERLFEEGLKSVKRQLDAQAAGLEFVSYTKLQGNDSESKLTEQQNKLNDDFSNLKIHARSNNDDESYQPVSADVKLACLDLCQMKSEAASIPIDDNKHGKGTAIKVIDFTLSENVATLVCSKVAVVVQCTRCRTKCDFEGLPRKTQRLSCQKCNHIMNATFRPAMLHQYSAIIGYLDLEGCKAFDMILLKSEFNITCLNCNKTTVCTGLANGQTTNTFCFICHTKMAITLNVFKFQVLDEISMSDKIDTKLIKKKKELKDPAIQDGKPLPDNGICKHYKRSYRWLRFPCCGKCYPCDVCHEEKEGDHEMKFAIRMLCGHCAKEQTYSVDKPCTRCHANLTKKSTGHWDNGKGCRNKVKMSRDDKQKYSGVNKTTAKSVEDKKMAKTKS